MAKVVYVKDLQPGDRFIWADDYTREWMNAEENEVLGTLTLEERSTKRVNVQRLNGDMEMLWLDEEGFSVALVIEQENTLDVNLDVLCDNCGKRFGNHYGNSNAEIECHKVGSGELFVPNEMSLRKLYKFPATDDFFAELGL